MALPPTIPTSFVPHPGGAGASQKFRADFTGAFGFLAYVILGVTFVLALSVFFYGRILAASLEKKDAELAKAEAAIDPATVQGFVRLRDRLASSQTLLNNHLAFSRFLAALEALLPGTVRLSTAHVTLDNTGTPKVEGTGVAKSFNALAFASTAFATDGRIKDVIFSNIVISSRDSSVAFSLTATLEARLIAFTP